MTVLFEIGAFVVLVLVGATYGALFRQERARRRSVERSYFSACAENSELRAQLAAARRAQLAPPPAVKYYPVKFYDWDGYRREAIKKYGVPVSEERRKEILFGV